MGLNSDNVWVIDNDLLHGLLTYGDGTQKIPGLKACWSIGHGFYVVIGVITWLTMRALKIERLPWHADWPFTHMKYEDKYFIPLLKYMNENPAVVNQACDEIVSIYQHTQNFYKGQSHLKLGRGYKDFESNSSLFGDYAKTLYRHSEAARLLGQPAIEVPHDVITSWGTTSQYSNCIVGVNVEIPVKDILLSHETIAPRKHEIQTSAIERGEFLILNRNWNGMFEIPVGSVSKLTDFNLKLPVTPEEAKKKLRNSIPPYRPMIHHNKGFIERSIARQAFSSRLSRAWEIITTKYQ